MFEGILNFFKKLRKNEKNSSNSGDKAKERLHLVLMQDRANVSADFLELMKQEIIDVIKKYIEVDESAIDVRLTNKNGEDGENGAPALYANIPILNIRNDMKKIDPSTGKTDLEKKPEPEKKGEPKPEESKQEIKENQIEQEKQNKQEEARTESIKTDSNSNQENKQKEKQIDDADTKNEPETKTNEDEANLKQEDIQNQEIKQEETGNNKEDNL